MADPIATYTKTSAEVLDYRIDWSRVLDADGAGVTIASDSWTVTGATKGTESTSGDVSSVVISGGTAGDTAELACTMTTSAGLTYVRTIAVLITE